MLTLHGYMLMILSSWQEPVRSILTLLPCFQLGWPSVFRLLAELARPSTTRALWLYPAWSKTSNSHTGLEIDQDHFDFKAFYKQDPSNAIFLYGLFLLLPTQLNFTLYAGLSQPPAKISSPIALHPIHCPLIL